MRWRSARIPSLLFGFLTSVGEGERHAVDEQRDVWAEFVIAVLAGDFGDGVEGMTVEIFEVDELEAADVEQAFVKGFAEIFVFEQRRNFL